MTLSGLVDGVQQTGIFSPGFILPWARVARPVAVQRKRKSSL
jgi:hypothetical protein